MTDTLATPWRSDPAYAAYVTAQVAKTTAMRWHTPTKRVRGLVHLLRKHDARSPMDRSVLCVGCRNGYEVRVLRAAGFSGVIGIDLMMLDAEELETIVVPMDMHALTFPDASFDAVFSCHSLEHAYDIDQALKEWARVTKPGGTWAIEVPIGFTTTAVDRHDFKSLDGLQAACASYLSHILHSETSSDWTVARLIGVRA